MTETVVISVNAEESMADTSTWLVYAWSEYIWSYPELDFAVTHKILTAIYQESSNLASLIIGSYFALSRGAN